MVREAAHQRHLATLLAMLDHLPEGKWQLYLVLCGSAPPHHALTTRVVMQSSAVEELKKELAKLAFVGGGFGSCLWDGVAHILALLSRSTSARKLLCIVPSSMPAGGAVRRAGGDQGSPTRHGPERL